MRPAFVIISANAAAFGFGAVVATWLVSVSGVMAAKAALPARGASPAVATASCLAPATPGALAGSRTVAAAPAAVAAPPRAQAPAGSGPAPRSQAAPAASAETEGGYLLQFGAFRKQEDAARLQRVLQGRSYPARIVPLATRIGAFDLVEISGVADRSAAQDAARALQRETGLAPLVMKAAAS